MIVVFFDLVQKTLDDRREKWRRRCRRRGCCRRDPNPVRVVVEGTTRQISRRSKGRRKIVVVYKTVDTTRIECWRISMSKQPEEARSSSLPPSSLSQYSW
jgi:hypothetical protein